VVQLQSLPRREEQAHLGILLLLEKIGDDPMVHVHGDRIDITIDRGSEDG